MTIRLFPEHMGVKSRGTLIFENYVRELVSLIEVSSLDMLGFYFRPFSCEDAGIPNIILFRPRPVVSAVRVFRLSGLD